MVHCTLASLCIADQERIDYASSAEGYNSTVFVPIEATSQSNVTSPIQAANTSPIPLSGSDDWTECEPVVPCGHGGLADDFCGGMTVYGFTGIDSWRGVADGSFQNNNGVHIGANSGGPLAGSGLGWQAGASYGVYDWNGRLSAEDQTSTAQQSFITLGVFRRADECSRWSGGIVVDQMIADSFGIFADDVYLAQVRYQLAYAVSYRNEIGFWATNELNQDEVFFDQVSTRAVNQANIFCHHKFQLGADTWLYVGTPTNDRVGGAGTLGDFIFGGSMNAPLNDELAMYGNFAYLDPTAPVGPAGSEEDSFYVALGLAWYPYCNARSRTVAGNRWAPYMPVANNGTFLIDQSVTF